MLKFIQGIHSLLIRPEVYFACAVFVSFAAAAVVVKMAEQKSGAVLTVISGPPGINNLEYSYSEYSDIESCVAGADAITKRSLLLQPTLQFGTVCAMKGSK